MEIKYSSDAKKFLRALEKSGDKKAVRLVRAKIDALAENPAPPGAKKVRGYQREIMRIPVGGHRIIYAVQDDTLQILSIGKRNDDEVYREFGRKH